MIHSLGKLTTTSGTLVPLTNNQAMPNNRQSAHSFLVQAHPDNTGKVYLFDRPDGTVAQLNGIIAILAVPTANSLPSFNATVANTAASFDLSHIWFDVEVDGEGVIVSFVQQ